MSKNIIKLENALKSFFVERKKAVFFVHGSGAAKLLIKFKKYLNNDFYVIIPTSVATLFVLDKENIPYKTPENYCNPEELYRYTKNIEKKVMNFAKEADQHLENNYSGIKESGLKPALYNLFSFVRIFSPLADAYFKIEKIIEQEKPDRIAVISEGKESENQFKEMLFWEADENIFKKIIRAYYSNASTYFFDLSKKKSVGYIFKFWQNKIQKQVFKNARIYYLLKLLTTGWKNAVINIFSSFKLYPVILLNGEYDWKWCREELKKEGYFIYGEVNSFFAGFGNKNNNATKSIILELEKSNIDFFPLIKEKLKIFFDETVPSCLSAYEKTKKLVKRKNIKAVLYSINPTAVSKSIAHAAQKMGVPVIGWQHGDLNYKPTQAMVLNDLLVCDLFLSWGKGSDENRNITASELSLSRKTIIVGSSGLDKILSLKPDRKEVLKKIGINNIVHPIIVYASTMYYLSNNYNLSYPPWSDNLFYKEQKKIIDRLADLNGTKIIKLHPSSFYAVPELDEYCHSYKKNNVWPVRRKITAPLLFSVADIIIIDAPSTTILQAIASKKPVFCLDKFLDLNFEAKEKLKKRVVLGESGESLMERLQLFLQNGKYEADLNNMEFLENYGTSSDGRAAERAASAVDELIKNMHV